MGNVKVGFVKSGASFGLKTPFEYKDKCRSLDFKHWDKINRIWTTPATRSALENIFHVFGREDVEITDTVQQMYEDWTQQTHTFRGLKDRMDLTMADVTFRTRTAPLIINGEEVEAIPRPYQIAGILASLARNAVLLNDEMGLGKTRQAIDSAVARFDRGECERAIVIVPAPLKYTWGGTPKQSIIGEIQKWAPPEYGRYEHVMVLAGDAGRRMKLLQYARAYRWIIVNFELLDKHKRALTELCAGQLVIIDEMHRIKNRKAVSAKAARELKPKYLIGMTGTPVANMPLDVWNLADMAEPGILGSHFDATERYTEKGGYQGKEIIRYVKLDELGRRLEPVMIRRTKAQCLPQLPPKVYQTQHVDMEGDQLAEYKRMEEFMFATYSEMPETDFKLQAMMALSQLLRLQQISDGFLSSEGHEPQWFASQPKLVALDQVVQDVVVDQNEKMVVWSRFRPATDAIAKRYAKHGAVCYTGSTPQNQRAVMVDRFMNDPDCRVFVGQIHTGGLGLTLTSAQTQVFYDLWWSPAIVQQAEDRLHRIGTRGTVQVIRLLCRDSIDENVEKMLNTKSKWANVITGDEERGISQQLLLNLLAVDRSLAV